MAPAIRLHEGIHSALRQRLSEGSAGWLLSAAPSAAAAESNDSVTPVSAVKWLHFSSSRASLEDLSVEAADLRLLLPRGFQIIGAFIPGSAEFSDAQAAGSSALNLVKQMRDCMDVSVQGGTSKGKSSLVAAVGLEDGNLAFFSCCEENVGGLVEERRVEIVPGGVREATQKLWEGHVLLRCQLAVSLPVYLRAATPTSEEISKAISTALEGIEKDLRSDWAVAIVEGPSGGGSTQQGPHLVQVGQLGLRDVPGGSSSVDHPLCGEFRLAENAVKTASGCQLPLPANVRPRLRQSRKVGPAAAPFLQYLPADSSVTVRRLDLKLDVLAAPPSDMVAEVAVNTLVIPALCEQLRYVERIALAECGKGDVKLSAYHFCPPGFCHPVTSVYSLSYGESEKRAVEMRKTLHQRLGLPGDRPLLRTVNALTFILDSANTLGSTQGRRLRDVHVALPPSGVSGGQVALLQGSYEYFHYMQDHIDDSGWGCAYRSLQTIVSWFQLQHYTNLPVPTHRKIQETLVEMGDKEGAFVGSSQWIGAIELSYVLDQLLGVSCKILTVQSGADMPSKGRELARHFQTQGTPIMIGGGVLAYTLLGVDYNERTGECAFLILDPHYTGGEDPKSIRGGGWVGWKRAVTETGQDFFLKNAFYNLLMPQRPASV